MLVVSEAMSRRGGAVVNDDVLYRFRLRLFSLAAELGNVREAGRIFGVHPSVISRDFAAIRRAITLPDPCCHLHAELQERERLVRASYARSLGRFLSPQAVARILQGEA